MDTSPHSASSTSDELLVPYQVGQEVEQDGDVEEAEPHVHLPNPSYWPVVLSLAVAVAIAGFLFISSVPWVTIGAIIVVLIGILGWGLEDPMAPVKDQYVEVRVKADPWKFKIGQNVIDSQGKWLGKVQARFSHYILVERGRLLPKVFYVPQSAAKDEIKNNTIFLTLSEDDLVRMGLNSVPGDLYVESPEHGFPRVRGAAQFATQFARRPLSPAETGHYNYGRRGPGINTDASGSYHREEVTPTPQDYVTEGVYTTDRPIPPRVLSPD